jgi:hypothetical protein
MKCKKAAPVKGGKVELNPREGVFTRREHILIDLAIAFADGLRTRGIKLTSTEKIALDVLNQRFTNTFSSDYWDHSFGPTAYVFGLPEIQELTHEPHETL